MKRHLLHRFFSLLLSLVMLAALIPQISEPAFAGMKYTGVDLDFDSNTATVHYKCGYCGADYEVDCDMDDFYNDGYIPIIEADCTDIELNTDYCQMCYLDHVCMECLRPIEECDGFCYNCHQCDECHLEDMCDRCKQCVNELCDECLATGRYRCKECHEDYAYCDGCGRCLYALKRTNEVCFNEATHNTHCTTCCDPWVCDECGDCFYQREEYFCETCSLCLECGKAAGRHCAKCYECFDEGAIPCDDNDELCIECCIAEGNHCEICEDHVEDWCEGGKDCGHCADCAIDQDWICGSCAQCVMCNDLENCESCGFCMECCLDNRAADGCECLEFCPQTSDYESEEHMCAQCRSNFSCACDFCDFCGLCEECCLENAEAEGCVCGICVEDSEFAAHLCPECNEPTCVRGDFCDFCGLCATCCLENSEKEGCSCGICVDNDEFTDPYHKCSKCGTHFSCSAQFCNLCGLCEYCCEDEPDQTEYHGTGTQPGEIFIQPFAKRRSVPHNTLYDRAENTVSFRVQAYDPFGDLQYQWYVRVDGGTPQALANDSHYIAACGETLVFTSGVNTNALTVSVPCDACQKEYDYFCVISDGTGNVLSTSDSARLYGRHSYDWQRVDDDYHQLACVGCGEAETGVQKAHEIGPWQFASYATATKGARMVRRCNVCASISESYFTEPLGEDHTAHDYVYTPVMDTDSLGNPFCHGHARICRCGRQDGGTESHVWGMWIVTKPATENKKGSKYHECLLCNYRETVEIQRQTHEHIWNLHDYEAEFFRGGYSSKSHFQYCGDPDCNAVAFVEPHVYSSWSWQTETGTPNLGLRDETIERTCEICGYVQKRDIHQDYHALCFQNANLTAVSADNRWSSKKYTCTVTAAPPVGYYFTYWENVGQGPIKYEEYYTVEPYLGTVWKTYKKTDETIVISLDNYDENDNYLPLETIYELRANVERYDNNLTLYDKSRTPVFTLTPGDDIADNELFQPQIGPGSASLMEKDHGVIWYESQEEDEYGYRTVTLHLNGYDGGAIELDDTGLPCNLNIIVDGDSSITTTGQQGILGCLTGGRVTVSSENGSQLRISVRSGKEDCYGIRTGRSREYHDDKLTLCGNVRVQLNVTDTFGSSTGKAYGLYSNSWVAIEDSASARIEVSSYAFDVAYDGQVLISAAGIHADKELQLNTTGDLYIDASNVDVASGRKGVGIEARNAIIDSIGGMQVVYTANSRSAFNHEPTYDPRQFIYYESDYGTAAFRKNGAAVSYHPVKHLQVEPGYPVHFDVDAGGTLNVESVYRNAAGDYLVKPGDPLVFYTAPAPGYYGEIVLIDGSRIKPSASDDGVRTKYVLEAINGPLNISVGSGMPFSPFASQPELSQTNVYAGSEARLTYRMNDVLGVLKSHELFGGSASTSPKFSLIEKGGNYGSGSLITGSQTINRVFLQRYNDINGLFENTGISFMPSQLGNESFSDAKNAAEGTVRYRLMVLYDGREYTSDEFIVNWTDDPSDITEPMTTAVELYVRDGKFANGARCVDGGAWVRLDSETPILAFDTGAWVGTAETEKHFNRALRLHERDLVEFASFDYHTGVLTLYGDAPTADFDGDGEKECFDLSDQLIAVRVPEDASGGLRIDVLADATIEGDYEAFGWEGWYSGETLTHQEHSYAQTSVIRNESEGGFVRVTSKDFAVLALGRSGNERFVDDNMAYCGIKASGDIRVDGNVGVKVTVAASDDCVSTKNYGAARFGLQTGGKLTVRDTASLMVDLPIVSESKCLKGDAVAVDAAAVDLRDDSVTILESNAAPIRANETSFALQAGALNVTGSAKLTVTGRGAVPTPIRVDGDALWATGGDIGIHALGDGAATNGLEVSGELHVKAPAVISLEYRDGAEAAGLILDGEPVLDDDYIIYRNASEGSNPASQQYYPGTPYTVTVTLDEGGESYGPQVAVSRGGKTLHSAQNVESLDVCMGDTVTYIAPDAWSGYVFSGWEADSSILPDDLNITGNAISFTMPDRDVKLHAVYTCTAFDEVPPYFIITNEEATEGTLCWRIDTGAPSLYDVALEYLDADENGQPVWREFRYYEGGLEKGWSLRDDMQKSVNPKTGDYIYAGASELRLGEHNSAERVIDTSLYKTYRIRGGSLYYSQPFTIDFGDGIHVLLPDDMENPGLVIPSDYVGTEYMVDLGRYVWADSASASWSLTFSDMSGPIGGSVCEANVFENGLLQFIRNGAHGPIYAIEGGTYAEASFEGCAQTFRVSFDFGEIKDAEVYPLIISGRRVTDHNMSDVLGDGTVSYDPETKTLTLENAFIDEICPVASDGGLMNAAYGIAAAEDLTIRLKGENSIIVNEGSYCHGQKDTHTYSGTIVGIGNAVNDAWRPYLDEEDDFRITFTGSGSLSMRLDGEYGEAVHSLGDVAIDGGNIAIKAAYSGICSEDGSFTMNAGSLEVDVKQLACVSLSGSDARFDVCGGTLTLNGGTDSLVIAMSAENYANAENLQLWDGDMTLATKSAAYDLVNRAIGYDRDIYAVLDADGNDAVSSVEPPETIETLDYLRFVRAYPIWVNGERFTSDHLTISCGRGTASYLPELNTVYLKNAEITKGLDYRYGGHYAAAGIRADQSVNLCFLGNCKIDLSGKDYYTEWDKPYEPQDEETENGRFVYGIEADASQQGEGPYYLTMFGNSGCSMKGVRFGIESMLPITYDGVKLSVLDCEGGISGDMDVKSGSIRIQSTAYSIYGLVNTDDYECLYAYGGDDRESSTPLDMAAIEAAGEKGWGYDYLYFQLGDAELAAGGAVTRKMEDEDSKAIVVRVEPDTGIVTVTGDADSDAPALIAAYDADGRFLGLVTMPGPGSTETEEGAETLKIFWIDEELRPKAEAEEVPLE